MLTTTSGMHGSQLHSPASKSPLNMFRYRKLTLAKSRNRTAQAAAMASRSVLFPRIIKGWSRLELSLTCRQGDLADNLSEEGMQTKSSGTS